MNNWIPQEGDRVAVGVEGKVRKGRVAQVVMDGARVKVTTSAEDAGTLFMTTDVMPLYRWTKIVSKGGGLNGDDILLGERLHPLLPVNG